MRTGSTGWRRENGADGSREKHVQDLIQTNYAIDTFYFLVMGVLVMFMACGFSMLESGMVRAKNTAEILTKNVSLYAIACIMYMLLGYQLMYLDTEPGSVLPSLGFLLQPEHTAEEVLASGGEIYYSNRSDYFFQVVFVATAMSIVSGAVAERMRLWAFLAFAVVMTGLIYPIQGMWDLGRWLVVRGGLLGLRRFGHRAPVRRRGRPGRCPDRRPAGGQVRGRRPYQRDSGLQHAARDARHVRAVVRLVRVQRGLGTQALRHRRGERRRAGVRQHEPGRERRAGCRPGPRAPVVRQGGPDHGAERGPRRARIDHGRAARAVRGVGDDGRHDRRADRGRFHRRPGLLQIDDPVGAISVHGVCGIWGIIAVVFSKEDATLAGQLLGVVGIFGWVFLASLVVWGALNAIMGIRVSEEDEEVGLDVSETGIEAYPDFTPV